MGENVIKEKVIFIKYLEDLLDKFDSFFNA